MAQWLTNPLGVRSPSVGQGSGIAMSCGVGCRRGSELGIWRRPAATAPIGPLAWEPPYAAGVAPEKGKKTKNKIK